MTGDLAGAEKLLRTYGRVSLTPDDQACVALVIEAHAGSLESQKQLVVNFHSGSTCYLMNVEFQWQRMLLHARLPAR